MRRRATLHPLDRDSRVRLVDQLSDALAGVALRDDDFAEVLSAAAPGDLVYLDPPYQPMSATADFAEYSAAGFDRDDQARLLDAVADLDARGVSFVLSNSGVTYEMYADAGFDVERVGATRSINSDEDARGEVDEIVATNVPTDRRRSHGQVDLGEF